MSAQDRKNETAGEPKERESVTTTEIGDDELEDIVGGMTSGGISTSDGTVCITETN